MSPRAPRTPRPLNVPRLVLWIASAALVGGGVVLLLLSNAKESAIYTSGTADYPALFAAQSGSTVGGYLIGAGVIGGLLGLVTLVVAGQRQAGPYDAVGADDAARPAGAWAAPVADSPIVGAESADDELEPETAQAKELDAPAPEEAPAVR